MNEANQSEDYKAVEFMPIKTARVMSPPDMPDYMIDFVVTRGSASTEQNVAFADWLLESNSTARQELLNGEFGTDNEAVATALKKEMDEKWQPCWHVTVGKNFGSYVVHQKRRFVYFTIGKTAFLVYKAQ